jgi:hypothetical protein
MWKAYELSGDIWEPKDNNSMRGNWPLFVLDSGYDVRCGDESQHSEGRVYESLARRSAGEAP